MLLMIAALSSDAVTGQLFWDGPRPGPNQGNDDNVPPVRPPTECQRNCAAALYDCLSSNDAPPFDPDTSCFNEFFDCNRGCPFREEKVAGLRGGHFIKRVVADDSLE